MRKERPNVTRIARGMADKLNVMTHAEAAVEDGYFGTLPEQRWDIARLTPDSRPLEPGDALQIGDELRSRIAAFTCSASPQ